MSIICPINCINSEARRLFQVSLYEQDELFSTVIIKSANCWQRCQKEIFARFPWLKDRQFKLSYNQDDESINIMICEDFKIFQELEVKKLFVEVFDECSSDDDVSSAPSDVESEEESPEEPTTQEDVLEQNIDQAFEATYNTTPAADEVAGDGAAFVTIVYEDDDLYGSGHEEASSGDEWSLVEGNDASQPASSDKTDQEAASSSSMQVPSTVNIENTVHNEPEPDIASIVEKIGTFGAGQQNPEDIDFAKKLLHLLARTMKVQ